MNRPVFLGESVGGFIAALVLALFGYGVLLFGVWLLIKAFT